MPSILPGFEYDIFISYRHNDNRSGWVTEFVKILNEELAATLKEPVSVYFDSNPHDGLLETHDVDESLKKKLNSYIFIPIISQTYCDVRSFAWRHEFLPFKNTAHVSDLGLKVTLLNGNVGSRILPICIHELDPSDKQLLEGELGSFLRGIEFIYKTTGVVRPLNPHEEDAKSNINHTYYRDQINKVARTIKELIASQQASSPAVASAISKRDNNQLPPAFRKKITLTALIAGVIGLLSFSFYYFVGFGNQMAPTLDKSIAVLPFENMNKDSTQDYFTNGITDDILNHLVKVSELKVKSRTSTLQYSNRQTPISEIGNELGVGNIVDGSVRRVGEKVRIVVQLIDTKSDVLWSETYDRDLKDVLAVQSEIAIRIANALKARLTQVEKESINREASQNITAYDYYLRAREIIINSNFLELDYRHALQLLNTAIKLDSTFSRAYALKAEVWFALSAFGIKQKIWEDSSLYFAAKAIQSDSKSPDGYVIRGYIHEYLSQPAKAKADFYKAFKLSPNSPDVLAGYGEQLLNDRDERGADLKLRANEVQYSLKDPEYFYALEDAYFYTGDFDAQERLLNKSKRLNPGSFVPYVRLSDLYRDTGQYKKALTELEEAEKINPTLQGIIDRIGWISYLNHDLPKAAKYWSRYKELESKFDTSQNLPFRHRLGMVYSEMGRKKEADALFTEDLKIHTEILKSKGDVGVWEGFGGAYYSIAIDNSYFGNHDMAVRYLDSAVHYQFTWRWGFHNDPLLDPLRQREDFKLLMGRYEERYEFRKRAYANALNRLEASKDLKSLLK